MKQLPLRTRSRFRCRRALLWLGFSIAATAFAHSSAEHHGHPVYDRTVAPPAATLPGWRIARAEPAPSAAVDARPALARVFLPFAPRVALRWDRDYLYVESNGLPTHGMMVGITAWQQQVPLPQPYVGANAWRIPLQPVPAVTGISIRDRFLRGAIALAANGIPIFNPQNNRGELSQEIGELDQWGGHCGRADDYHYHVAPLHLQSVVGPAVPIAVALDGYPIYGLTEPDGTAPLDLDAWRGHNTPALGYHYHASKQYPYVNGGFRGVVTEREGQVDPQPRAQGVRAALTALRGARITGFTAAEDERSFALRYEVRDRPASVDYAAAGDGSWKFRFADADGTRREAVYSPESRRGGGGGGGPEGGKKKRPPSEPKKSANARTAPPATPATASPAAGFALLCPALGTDGQLPVEFTGDGRGVSPPLEWQGAPAGTRSFALVMDHLDPEGKTKWYWTLYNIPADAHALPADSSGIGILGNNGVNRRVGYAPPHSKGPGMKSYTLTLYALSQPLDLAAPPDKVSRDVLLAALKNVTLGTAVCRVHYSRDGQTPEPKRNPTR